MPAKFIHVKGVRVHNLKNIELTIPRDKLVVFTGLSGSGKSSLAFDTIYAEGHRRFVESLSSYARQFLGQLDKPDIDFIEGLSPAISIDQKTTSKNPRSTVGTVTEIYDYLRLLYARVGIPHCPVCGKEIYRMPTDVMIDRIMAMPEGTKFMVSAPVARGKKGRFEKVFDDARKNGFSRARVDGTVYSIDEIPELDKNKKHNIEILVDRLVRREAIERLFSELKISAVRGNLSEISVIAGFSAGEQGVDTGKSSVTAEEAAIAAARKRGCICAATGKYDIVSDGSKTFRLENGTEMLSKITGAGCMTSALCAAYSAASDPFSGTILGVAAMGICGELSAEKCSGAGSFRTGIFDEISKLTAKKTYYVRVRAYKKSSGKKIYGKWSKIKKVKIKK